jgi:hypothetical protein
MLFFKVRGEMGKQFAWASGYGPLPKLPFLEEIPTLHESFKRYWDVNPEEPGLHIDPGASVWPDFLGCGNSPPSFFVSDVVIDDLEANGIPIWRKTEFPIGSNQSKKLQDKKPPRYFVIEAKPGIAIDFDASGVVVDAVGKPQFTKAQRLNQPVLQLDLNTWNGSDLFSISNLGSKLTLLCTEKVKALAEKERWTNVRFEKQWIAGTDPWSGN